MVVYADCQMGKIHDLKNGEYIFIEFEIFNAVLFFLHFRLGAHLEKTEYFFWGGGKGKMF